jgi:chemotaxis protein histidine kinase CheA
MTNLDLQKLMQFEANEIRSSALATQLEKDLSATPWFQAGWMLLAKMQHHQEHADYQKTLSKTAAFALDRSQLFDLIYHQDLLGQTIVAPTPELAKEEPKPVVSETPKQVQEEASPEEHQKKIQERLKQIAAEQAERERLKAEEEAKNAAEEEKRKQEEEQLRLQKEEEERKAAEEEKRKVEEELKAKEAAPEKEEELAEEAIEEQEAETTEEAQASVEEPESPSLEEEMRLIDEAEKERRKEEIIERFIQNQPSVQRPSESDYFESTQKAKQSLEDRLDFVSETLAEIYLKQGNKKKSIEIYKQLSLKYPEKKRYFAAQIQKLK